MTVFPASNLLKLVSSTQKKWITNSPLLTSVTAAGISPTVKVTSQTTMSRSSSSSSSWARVLHHRHDTGWLHLSLKTYVSDSNEKTWNCNGRSRRTKC